MTALDRLEAALAAHGCDPKRRGEHLDAKCPSHDDHVASFTADQRADKVLAKCHAGNGCPTEAIVAALDLPMSALFDEPISTTKSEVSSTYPYTDAAGTVMYEVVRLVPKSFRLRRTDGRGGWIWDMKGVERVPYRLPELLAGIEAGRLIVIAEGERDCDCLIREGFVATTNAGGAGKWPAAWNRYFNGASVVVLVDNDAPGRQHGEQVAAYLVNVAEVVKVIELPGLAEHGDVSDWFAAGGTAEELERVITEAPQRSAAVEKVVANAEPLPPRLISAWPVLDPIALHGLAGQIVATIEPQSEADQAGILVSLLVEFGALVGSGPHALADSAQHPARLFAVLVGDTSKGRKGSAAKGAERVTALADPHFARERRLNGFGSGEVLVDTVRGTAENGHDPRLLVFEPEFARILNVAARDGSTLSAIIRQAWDGGRLSARSRSATTVAEDSHVCVLGHITADELRAKLTATEVANGFANRFLLVCVKRSKLLPSGGNLDDAELASLARKFAARAIEAREVRILRRTPAAEALWVDFYGQMADDEPGGLVGAIIARDAPQCLRLSVTYALLDGSRTIDVEHVRAAWAMWTYCRDSVSYIFGESIGDPTADRLLRGLRGAGPDGLDGRQRSALFAGHASRPQLEAASELLVGRGLATAETVQSGGRPVLILRAAERPLFANSLSSHALPPLQAPSSTSNERELSEQRCLEGQRGQTSPLATADPYCGESELGELSPTSTARDPYCEQSEQSPDDVPWVIPRGTWDAVGERVAALSPDSAARRILDERGYLTRIDLTREEYAEVLALVDDAIGEIDHE